MRGDHHRRPHGRLRRGADRAASASELKKEILKDLKRKTDVKVEDVLFPDVTVQ